MGRRLHAILAIALAVASGSRMAPGQQAPLPAPADSLGAPAEVPPPVPIGNPEGEPAPDPGAGFDLPAGADLALPKEAGAPLDAVGDPGPGAMDQAPPVDPGVEPTASKPDPAQAAPGAPAAPFVLPVEQLRAGKQAVGLSVHVEAQAVVNLHQEAPLKIIVRNTGATDAMNVAVYYQRPDGLEVVECPPEATDTKVHVIWKLDTLAAGAERALNLRVRAKQVGSLDHAATVVLMTGTKAATHVQQPLLKVEQTARNRSVLKGGQAQFDITVSNPGSGPARDVLVQAKLSAGLRHEEGDYIELILPVIEAGKRVDLAPLIADAEAGGEQSCTVTVSSKDVPMPAGEVIESRLLLEVVEPRLELQVSGPEERYSDTVAQYRIKVSNPGTAPAQTVRVWAMMPVGASPLPDMTDTSNNLQYSSQKRFFLWTIPQINAGKEVELSFAVRLGGLQFYKVSVEARAERPLALRKEANCSTSVVGMAVVDFDVLEDRRVLDVGETTTYEIKIENNGNKDALDLRVSAELSEHLTVESLADDYRAKMSPDKHQIVFDPIDRLPPKGRLTLRVNVKAIKSGAGTCKVGVAHDDIGVTRSTYTRITEPASAALR